MVEKKIKALKDFELRTFFGPHYMIDGEVRRIRFKNQQTFESLLKFGNFVEAEADEKEVKVIPVIHPAADENTIVEIDNTTPEDVSEMGDEEQSVEEISIDEAKTDEVSEPMSEVPPEYFRRDEPPQVEEEIDCRDTTEARPTDTPDVLNEPEELTPEEETEGLVEVEEIPIDEARTDEEHPQM